MKPLNANLSIDVIGQPLRATGWATHSIGFARAMKEFAEVRFRTRNIQDALRGFASKDRTMFYHGLRKGIGDFGVVIIGEPLCAKHSSRWIVWETSVLPAGQKELCSRVGFVWAPSTWGLDTLIANGIEAHRAAVVPEGVDADFYTPGLAPKKSKRFRFLSVGKWENRKFTDGLVRAFAEEFNPREDVELYLLAYNPYIPHFSVSEKLKQSGISNHTNIIIGKVCERQWLRTLYQSANCFVLPTRAEGWGLPILESMACGVPAIVTRYSAPLDYVTEDNGYFLNVERMVDAQDSQFDICTGQWAEPDSAHLRFLMRQCFQNPSEVHEKGMTARDDALRFTWRNSAQIALKTIDHHLKICSDG